MMRISKRMFKKAKKNIKDAQNRSKKDYDRKHHQVKVCEIMGNNNYSMYAF